MRIFAFIISFILISKVTAADKLSTAELDSVYGFLTAEQKVQKIIWWQLDNNTTLPPTQEINQQIGALYLPHPLTSYDAMIFGSNGIPPLAVQLDHRLNPAPESLTNLPSLLTLSSITDKSIIISYAEYLEKLCRSYHLSYAVLPSVGKDSVNLNEVLKELHELNPNFFLTKEKLNFDIFRKRKELESALADSRYLVSDYDNFVSIKKYLPRILKKSDVEELHTANIKLSLQNRYDFTAYTAPHLSGKLDVKINRASIIPVQRDDFLLPIKADTICLITSVPNSKLVDMIRKYAYVITAIEDVTNIKTPIIFVGENNIPALSEDQNIIFIGRLTSSEPLIKKIDAGLLTTRESELYDYLIPQLLFGTAGASGRLPVDHGEWASFTNKPIIGRAKLGYAPPEMIGLDSINQTRIREIVKDAIKNFAIPGCQIAVAVDGSILYEEGFGYLTYDSLIAVTENTIYDIASVTKVASTLLAVMKLTQENRLHLDSSISHYLPKYKNTNKENITLRSLLSHNAGLKSYVPFWKRVIGADRLESFYYASDEDMQNDKRSYGLKPSPILLDSLQNWIRRSPIQNSDEEIKYVYSDIGFMILHQVVEAITEQPIDEYNREIFYQPLALKRTHFNPLTKGIDRFEIAPTEYDYYFRDEQVWGEVHDRNAAVFGGVAGHAGLFSNAHDLTVIMQMLLQEGEYDEQNFLTSWVIDYFNKNYYPNNRRGLGWDKKSDQVENTSKYASDESFGHTGFTGTMIWVDPEYDLTFVFLSNRIYPNANNFKLNRDNVRTSIQDVVYEALLAKWSN